MRSPTAVKAEKMFQGENGYVVMSVRTEDSARVKLILNLLVIVPSDIILGKGGRKMAENLFILGAGASFDAGAPLMNGFFDKANELLGSGQSNPHSEAFKDVFHLLKELRPVYANSYLDLNNIESLFGAIEMGRIVNSLGIRSDDSIEMVRKSLIRLIVITLERSITFPINEGTTSPPRSYNKLAKLITEKIPASSIITFNYDIALDYALSFNSVQYQYCTDSVLPPQGIKLMKLHGSVNWALCKNCKSIVTISLNNGTRQINIGQKERLIQFHDVISHQEHNCSDGTRSSCEEVPVIVPPTWNKKDYHGSLTNVWRQAAIELSRARNIYVIGYSLPESDAFFRYLFALGTIDNDSIKRFWVYNPDGSEETKARYATLLGKGISVRYDYKEKKFDEAISDISNNL
jgi:hypothetical protein